jgi:hypothetical protein
MRTARKSNTRAERTAKEAQCFAHVHQSLWVRTSSVGNGGIGLKNVSVVLEGDPEFFGCRKSEQPWRSCLGLCLPIESNQGQFESKWEHAAIDLNSLCDAGPGCRFAVTVFDNLSSDKHVSMDDQRPVHQDY